MTDGARPNPNDARKAIVCQMLVRERAIVGEAFGRSLCANPVWDMLLALYIARCEQRFVMLTALCASSHASEGTAYRRIADLERRGLVVRDDDARDRRRVEIRLSDDGVALVGDVLSRIDLLITSIGPEGR